MAVYVLLGHAISDRYIGIYKEYLSLYDQRIVAAAAGKELEAAGYHSDVEAIELTEQDAEMYRERDGRARAAWSEMMKGIMMIESYNCYMVEQRAVRAEKGIWDPSKPVESFPIGDLHEDFIIGHKLCKKWMDHFGIERIYRNM